MRGWRAWARPHGDSAARRLCVFLSSNRAAPAALNGSPLQSDHALLSPLFSLLSTHHFVVQNRFFVCFVFFVVSFHSGDARRNRRAGAPTRANHALPSPLFSLLSAENQIWIIFYQIFVLAVIAIVHHTGKEVREWARN